MPRPLIATRIKALREKRGLSQDALARLLGFKDRQTVSAIETGTRRVTADELVLAAVKMEESLEYFTDPFQLVGEGRFSWRQTGADAETLSKCERKAGRWISAFRLLAPLVERAPRLMRPTLRITAQSWPVDAMLAGEHFAADYELGAVPAVRLAEVMQQEFGILVLMVDADHSISGAACRLPELDAVLISRNEVPGRRHFDLAHELFHILTWDALPPKHREEASASGKSHAERLADNFASAVLTPRNALERFGQWKGLTEEELISRLNEAADELQVTSSALRWRLAALGKLERTAARSLSERDLRNNGGIGSRNPTPALFSKPFVEVLGVAIEQGHISLRRAARLLEMTIEDLGDLFAAHGVARPVEL